MQRAELLAGLNFGDEAKGATVDFLTRRLEADMVVRYGHTVELPDGTRHVFSQFGAGVLANRNLRTYLSRHVIIDPLALAAEAAKLWPGKLRWDYGLHIHPDALLTTIYHRMANRHMEERRWHQRHGSCGMGIGETRKYWLEYGADAITARDLWQDERGRRSCRLHDKLSLLAARQKLRFPGLDWPRPSTVYTALKNPLPVTLITHVPKCQTAIFEGAQGVLLDEYYGFEPHTTWSDTTLRQAYDVLDDIPHPEWQPGEICTLGITRAYTTRHGAGPFPTERKDYTFEDQTNCENPWQGSLRFGDLDLPLLRYAASVANPGGKLDGLVVNCLDHTLGGKVAYVDDYFTRGAGACAATIRAWMPPAQRHWHRLEAVLECPPKLAVDNTALLQLLDSEIAPVIITSHGPTHLQRALLQDLPFRPYNPQEDHAKHFAGLGNAAGAAAPGSAADRRAGL